MMNTRSIRFQLLAWYAALLFSAFAIFGVFMYAALGGLLRQNLRDTLVHRARQVARSMNANSNHLSPGWLRDEISLHYAPESSGRFVRITTDRTNVVYLSGLPEDRSFDPAEVHFVGQPVR